MHSITETLPSKKSVRCQNLFSTLCEELNGPTDMTRLIPKKLHVKHLHDTIPDVPLRPRFYTLTHSDFSGDPFLSIGPHYDTEQISGLYTRLMRDEMLAELKEEGIKLYPNQ